MFPSASYDAWLAENAGGGGYAYLEPSPDNPFSEFGTEPSESLVHMARLRDIIVWRLGGPEKTAQALVDTAREKYLERERKWLKRKAGEDDTDDSCPDEEDEDEVRNDEEGDGESDSDGDGDSNEEGNEREERDLDDNDDEYAEAGENAEEMNIQRGTRAYRSKSRRAAQPRRSKTPAKSRAKSSGRSQTQSTGRGQGWRRGLRGAGVGFHNYSPKVTSQDDSTRAAGKTKRREPQKNTAPGGKAEGPAIPSSSRPIPQAAPKPSIKINNPGGQDPSIQTGKKRKLSDAATV